MVLFAVFLMPAAALAQDILPAPPPSAFDRGRLLATGGVSQVEGAGGGGLSAWALITGYGSRNGVGVNGHYSFVALSDFHLHSVGAAVGLRDRLELSYTRMSFDTRDVGAALGLGRGFTFHQDVLGAKLKLFGDAVFDQDRWWPQVAVGAQYKSNDRGPVVRLVGARDDDGVDFYLAASKLYLAQSILLNVALRATKANQLGLLGFGGDKDDGYSAQVEGSAAVLLNRRLAVGVEYRSKPDNLSFAREQDAADIFVAYFPNKFLSLTAAYVALGDIALQKNQNGLYLSLQAGF
jgi:hypothetical protein